MIHTAFRGVDIDQLVGRILTIACGTDKDLGRHPFIFLIQLVNNLLLKLVVCFWLRSREIVLYYEGIRNTVHNDARKSGEFFDHQWSHGNDENDCDDTEDHP